MSGILNFYLYSEYQFIMIGRLFILFFLTGIAQIVNAQDPQFSQYYANPIYTNPGFTGTTGNLRLVMAGRNQYTALNRNYKTASASIDGNIGTLNGGIGLIGMTDVAGDGFLTTTTISGVYSYHLALNRKVSMRSAIQAGVIQKSYDFNQFKFGDQIDDRLGFVKATLENRALERILIPNFSAGVIVYTNQIFGGVAVHNLVEPNQSFYFSNSTDDQFKLPRRYTIHGGANIYLTHQRNVDERIYISPNILYMQQRNFNQLNLGMYVKKDRITAGVWMRQTMNNTDALIGMVGLKFPKFRVGYSYDVIISKARTATVGTHEVTVAMEFKLKKREVVKRIPRYLKCPDL